jgi:adenine-specific DNA-methyltransferase
VRYIGNKTRLLPFIRRTIKRLAIPPGVAHDAFAGTAAVARALKADGWRVVASDVMTYSYVLQRAYVVASRVPSLERLRDGEPAAARLLGHTTREANGDGAAAALLAAGRWLADAPDSATGFIAEHFAPAGGRMYFTDENARRIDAARAQLHCWHAAGLIDDDAFYLLLAGIIEGADRVANTAGVYAAYIKRWQPNAQRPFTLVPELPVERELLCAANLADAGEVAARLGPIDLLYVDPPYNARQYSGYYHVPEIIARGWFDAPLRVRGKTGLPDERALPSPWCSRRAAPRALHELLSATGATHVLVSYNSEGVIPDAQLRDAMKSHAIDGRVKVFTHAYRRYRADSDREGRRYTGDAVKELLYYARLR